MSLTRAILCGVLFLLSSNKIQAQLLIKKNLIIGDTFVLLDSNLIIENSIKIKYNQQLFTGFKFVQANNGIVFNDSMLNKQIEIVYRTFNLNYKFQYSNKPKELIEPIFNEKPQFYTPYQENNQALLFSNGLNVNGNIARGLGFGNNQDVVLNSNLNLQLGGKLGNGFSILAAISDENNPIQPEGNTQQIQDFDKVYITLMKDSNSLTVGDVLMKNINENYFLKFYKKSRGLQFDYKYSNYHLQSDVAISRGRFSRNEIQGIEGVQGPYRLNGVNNELNIIVISGTEAVYIDGKKLNRGQQNDYVIDYNVGEITFMPKQLITKFSRIVVEFQYSDRNYARSVVYFGNQLKFKNWTTIVNYFSEQDNKQQLTDTTNKNAIQNALELSGDKKVIFKNVTKFSNFTNERVMYRIRDSLGYTIYVHSKTDVGDTAYFNPVFSFVGNNLGNYIPIASSTNGRVYAWVSPIGGVPQGTYEPVVELIAPKRNQMLTWSNFFQLNPSFQVKLEGAYSNNNENTYSVLDKKNDDGLGLFAEMIHQVNKHDNLKIKNNFKVEMVNQNFKFIERYRNVEFNRIWNRQLNNSVSKIQQKEIITSAVSEWNIKQHSDIKLEFNNYLKGNSFKGNRLLSEYGFNYNNASLRLSYDHVSTNEKLDSFTNKNFASKILGSLEYKFKNHSVVFNHVFDESKFKIDTNRLLSNSFKFFENKLILNSNNSQNLFQYKIEASERQDFSPLNQLFSIHTIGRNVNTELSYSNKKGNRINVINAYRYLKTIQSNTNEDVILNRIEYNANYFKRVVNLSTYYQIGNGREQKKQYSYALVQAGNGVYQWVDYNANGIEEINEFEVAAFPDQAKYIKLFLPTNEFIKSNLIELNQTLRLQAPSAWYSKSKLKQFLTRFNTISLLKIDRKMTDNRFQSVINPFYSNITDTSLISISNLLKQTSFYNRNSGKFGVEHNIQSLKSKMLLNSGFESRKIDKQNAIIRYNFSKLMNLVTNLELTQKETRNQFFNERNYNYLAQRIHPELFFQTIKGYRIGLFYAYLEAKNDEKYGGEKAFVNEFGIESRYFISGKGNIDLKISSIQIQFDGNNNSPLAFDLLNGLNKGKNLTWNLNLGLKTKGNVQINVSYNGRQSENSKTIHIGRAEARYIF